MKISIAKKGEGYTAYVAKKDLEQPVVAMERPELWGGWIDLANGWRLSLPAMDPNTRLPVTVEAKKIGE